MKSFFTLILILLACAGLRAQHTPDTSFLDVGDLKEWISVTRLSLLHIDSTASEQPAVAAQRSFVPLSSFAGRKRLPIGSVSHAFFLKTFVYNSSTVKKKLYFFPGSYYDRIEIYKIFNGKAEPVICDDPIEGYMGFSLEPNEAATLLVELKPTKIDYDNIGPVIINSNYIASYKMIVMNSNTLLKSFSFVLSGTLLMMVIFMLANFMIYKKREFLYNSLYSLMMFLLIFLNAHSLRNTTAFTSLYLSYFDLFLLVAGNLFYMSFSRVFLNSKVNYKKLDKLLLWSQRLLIILMTGYTYLNFFVKDYTMQDLLENVIKCLMLCIGISFIVLAAREKNKLLNYLAAGNAALVIASVISLAIILVRVKFTSLFVHSLFYYYTGIVIELVFFLVGLNYKNKRELIEKIKEQEALKLEAEKQEFQTQLAVIKAQQEERNRISADMHDDLGAGMTTIRLYSELAKDKLKDRSIPEIEKISSSANELLTKMNAIIWSMSSSNDSLINMTAYIRSYALEYFENTGIDCRITIPVNLPKVEVSGKIRRNVFLVVKEALNNVLKHSAATVVQLTLQLDERSITLYIQDNGKGINFDQLRQFSNGLINMRKRMKDVSIDFSIENKEGTLVTLKQKIHPHQ